MTTAITVSALRLRMMLAGVLPHASCDGTLPVLCGVKIEVRSGVLYLAATDRYSIGVAKQRIPGWGWTADRDVDAMLGVDAAGELSALLAGHTGAVALVLGDEQPPPKLTADLGEPPVKSWQTMALSHPGWPSGTVTWQSILYPMLSAAPATLDGGLGVEMRLLGRFAAIDPTPYAAYAPYGYEGEDDGPEPEWPAEGSRIKIVAAGKKGAAALVTRGEWFIGAAMACQINMPASATPAWDEWAGTLGGGDAGSEPA
jgi:hypothetical protein